MSLRKELAVGTDGAWPLVADECGKASGNTIPPDLADSGNPLFLRSPPQEQASNSRQVSDCSASADRLPQRPRSTSSDEYWTDLGISIETIHATIDEAEKALMLRQC